MVLSTLGCGYAHCCVCDMVRCCTFEVEFMKTKYKHIYFEDISVAYPKRKTSTYVCKNHLEIVLGWISWASSWRQYTFTPRRTEELIFAASCLDDISHFIKQLMNKRAVDKKRNKVQNTCCWLCGKLSPSMSITVECETPNGKHCVPKDVKVHYACYQDMDH